MTSYDKIFTRFLRRIEDYDLMELCDEDFYNSLLEYLDSAVARFRVCKNDLFDRDDELGCFKQDLLPIEIEIIILLMTRAWIEPQLKSDSITRQAWSGKETKFFAQANHMEKLQEMYDKALVEAHKLHRDYTYQNGAGYFD